MTLIADIEAQLKDARAAETQATPKIVSSFCRSTRNLFLTPARDQGCVQTTTVESR